jgi:hypothetical protein
VIKSLARPFYNFPSYQGSFSLIASFLRALASFGAYFVLLVIITFPSPNPLLTMSEK